MIKVPPSSLNSDTTRRTCASSQPRIRAIRPTPQQFERAGDDRIDAVLVDGRVDVKRIRPIARLGYQDYAVVDTVFPMVRPGA